MRKILTLVSIIPLILTLIFFTQASADSHDDLIISEYIEGSSYNKAIEIYNGTGDTVDLSSYSIVGFTNGASFEPGDGYANELNLSGTLDSGETFVMAHSDADQAILDQADVSGNSFVYNFNGDDAIVLFKDYNDETREGTVVDSIGKVGEDPGDYWGDNLNKTQDMTLVRDISITSGDTNALDDFDPADEWLAFPRDTFDHIGSHEEVTPPDDDIKEEYHRTVDRIVDGDTIHVNEPILGETTIRFLNMDTPETYHQNDYDEDLILEDPNHSQKYHGEQATNYLNELLQSGDEVIIKVGEEPLDTYGRVLGEVVRKDDQLNTNLELVRQGYASTYFIWPTGPEDTYLEYQDAVREAKDNQRGIWSEDIPLMELPFVFRARYDGDALHRYVANSDTGLYYLPANWSEVPVDKRIFFEDELTALEEGYEPAFEREPIIADARTAPLGTNVTIEGTVTHKVESGNATNYYVQDHTAGIVVRTNSLEADVGDKIRAAGVTDEYYDMLQIIDANAEIIEEDSSPIDPALVTSSELGESIEAQLVKMEDVEILSVNQYNDYTARDSDGEFVIDNDAGFLEVGKTYDELVGVVDYNFDEFKLMPRSEDDVTEDIPLQSIQSARDAELDTRVHIEGVVTAAFYEGGMYNYYVQDDTAGMVVRANDIGAEVGDKISAKARTEEYFGLLQIIPSDENINVVEKGVGVPDAAVITSDQVGEELEGQLVTLKGFYVEGEDGFNNYQAYDENGHFVIDSDTHLVNEGEYYESITGVLTYNYDEYKIMPRDADDVVSAELLDYSASELVELADQFGNEFLLEKLEVELTENIETKGNTEQHIDSAMHHIQKALMKYQNQGKDAHLNKIDHELNKLFKRDAS
ncbi:thermonuclease family protein [Aquisalibacillus elongatus]|uniref:Endonuclease YncB(Thermonuclease family) n=1 Tax=Aquisalibacillus elongatus TaxID=485577 RepID=A0A3N5C6R5_9BACI|nr:thermonuclease family protein [Aquisalibacillus elongatus]RPF54005.1 endonuclease YncB(thermonuclease family) [Aquisalibacillus elongatus]